MGKKRIVDRIFPAKYPFFEMLAQEAEYNELGVASLCNWVACGSCEDKENLLRYVKEADDLRMSLEEKLVEAFSTPFDRGDIYSISVAMDRVIEYAKSTLLSMIAFDVKPDNVITGMLEMLKEGVRYFSASVKSLQSDPHGAEKEIPKIRNTHLIIEELYRDGMKAVFSGDDPMQALKQREVYHHIKDASSNLDESVDILHRIIVRLI